MVAATLSKIVVVVVNLIFMIFGLACLIVGIIFKLGWDKVREAFEDQVNDVDFDMKKIGDAAGYTAIIFGAFILIVSLLGCMGACCKFKSLLITYAVIVLLLLIAKIAVVAYVAAKGSDAEDKLEEGLLDSLKNYNETSSNSRSKAWSAVFSVGECCAVTDYKADFKADPFYKDVTLRAKAGISPTSDIPITCCSNFDYEDTLKEDMFTKSKECLNNPTKKNAYLEGCYSKVKDWISHSKKVLIGVGCSIILLEVIMICIAFFLGCRSD